MFHSRASLFFWVQVAVVVAGLVVAALSGDLLSGLIADDQIFFGIMTVVFLIGAFGSTAAFLGFREAIRAYEEALPAVSTP